MKNEKVKIATKHGEIEVTVYEKDGHELITTNSLKTAIEPFGTFSVPRTDGEMSKLLGYPVAYVVFTAKEDGKEYVGTGHGNLETITNEISRQNLPNIVINRAKSEAMLAFFGLEGKYYTTDQIQNDSNKQPEPTEPKVQPEPEETPMIGSEADILDEDDIPPEMEVSVEAMAEAEEDTEGVISFEEAAKHAITISDSSYKGKTIQELYDAGRKTLLTQIVRYADKRPDMALDAKYVKVFLENKTA